MTKRASKSAKSAAALPADYAPLLADIKAQLRAATGVTRELNRLYREIGAVIAQAQKSQGYGKQVVDRLAADLQAEFPAMSRFSGRATHPRPMVEEYENELNPSHELLSQPSSS